MLVIVIFVCLICFIVWIASMYWLDVRNVEVYFDKIDERLDGFSILQITDLHSDDPHNMNIDIWKVISKLDFDIMVITGDFIQDNDNQIDPHIDSLTELTARKKVYFVFGNHECKKHSEVSAKLNAAGVTVLCGENAVFEYNGVKIDIFGFNDLDYYKTEKMSRLYSIPHLPAIRDKSFTLVLSHQPQIFPELPTDRNILVLAGHTHGGQIRLPFMPVMYASSQGFFPKFGYGLYENKNSCMYVSKGIGATWFHVRFYNRPELAVIKIRKKQ